MKRIKTLPYGIRCKNQDSHHSQSGNITISNPWFQQITGLIWNWKGFRSQIIQDLWLKVIVSESV